MLKTICLITAGLVGGILLLNCLVDLAFGLFYRYCRFHIGRAKKRRWEKSVIRRAARWAKHTPVVKITDNSRYMLLDMLQGKYRSGTIQSWQKAALLLGLRELGEQEPVEKALDTLLEHGKWKQFPEAVDFGMLSYAVLQSQEDVQAVRPAMEETLRVMKTMVGQDGLLSYTGGPENPDLYVDTLGLACPFLCAYAKAYAAPEQEELAFRQLEYYHNHGLLPGTALPNHAVSRASGLPLGVYGWGRGTGWYVIGLLDSYEQMTDPAHREAVLQWLREAAEGLLPFQSGDGGFGATLQRPSTYDSSATAVLAWFYAKCGRLFENPAYTAAATAAMEKLRSVTRLGGAIDWCQGDTKDIGVFSQTYDIMPFAQGMTLRAMAALKED